MQNNNEIIKDDTCFAAHGRCREPCLKELCRYWMNNKDTQNCALVGAASGGMTLEQIGHIFGLTRMRVCQIEKNIYKKIIHQLEDQQL